MNTTPQSQPPLPKKSKVAAQPMNAGIFLLPLEPSSPNNPSIPNYPIPKKMETPWKDITKDIPEILQSTRDSSKLDFDISSGFNTSGDFSDTCENSTE